MWQGGRRRLYLVYMIIEVLEVGAEVVSVASGSVLDETMPELHSLCSARSSSCCWYDTYVLMYGKIALCVTAAAAGYVHVLLSIYYSAQILFPTIAGQSPR